MTESLKATPHIEQFTFLICKNQRINAIYFGIKKKKCKFGGIALVTFHNKERSIWGGELRKQTSLMRLRKLLGFTLVNWGPE